MAGCIAVGVGAGYLLDSPDPGGESLRGMARQIDPAGEAGAGEKIAAPDRVDPAQPAERRLAMAGGSGALLSDRLPPSGPARRANSSTPSSAGRSHRHTQVVEVAGRLSPAVVTIGLLVQEKREEGLPLRELLYPDARETLRTFAEGPAERSLPYVGSGVVFGPDNLAAAGYDTGGENPLARFVLTNYHVVNRHEDARITVTLADGRIFPADLVDADAVADVALLRIRNLQGTDIPTAPFADSETIMIGEPVIALGNPYGALLEDPHPTVTVGVVSALNRSFKPDGDEAAGRPRVYRNMIQTDAAINPGNSGGPLANYDGEVIGINTFIIAQDGGGSTGVNFAIPIDRAARVASEILQYGHVRPIQLDMDVWTVNRYLEQRFNLAQSTGLMIWRMAEGGAAESAGLQRGDVILKVEGRPVYRPDDLHGEIFTRTVGESVNLTVSRAGEIFETRYEIQQAPEPPGDDAD